MKVHAIRHASSIYLSIPLQLFKCPMLGINMLAWYHQSTAKQNAPLTHAHASKRTPSITLHRFESSSTPQGPPSLPSFKPAASAFLEASILAKRDCGFALHPIVNTDRPLLFWRRGTAALVDIGTGIGIKERKRRKRK